MRALANPVFLRAAVVLTCSVFAFLMTLLFMRKLRESIEEEAGLSADPTPSLENLPLHLYNTVIQQLKQQKHELDAQSRAEQQRARISESFSQAVLSNLSSGVLVFGTNGLVKTANPAAKEILGFASPAGMSPAHIFREATIQGNYTDGEGTPDATVQESASDESGDTKSEPNAEMFIEPVTVAAEIDAVLHEGSQRREVKAEYRTPAGGNRFLAVTISPVLAADGSLLGAACLINDLSDLAAIRRERDLHGEVSTEMALQLRTSLTTISDYAQQLANSRDAELARQLAGDIVQESAQLERSLGSFLTEKHVRHNAAAAGATPS